MAREKNTAGRPLAVKAAVAALLFLALQGTVRGCSVKTAETEASGGKSTIWDGMLLEMADAAEESLYGMFMPGILFERSGGHETCWLLQEQIDSLFPLYGYVAENLGEDENEGAALWDDGTLSEDGTLPEDKFLREILLAEADHGEESELSGKEGQEDMDRSMAELLKEENEAAMRLQENAGFAPHTQQIQVDLESLQDYENLLKQFYIVDSNTMASSDRLNVESFLAKDMTVSGWAGASDSDFSHSFQGGICGFSGGRFCHHYCGRRGTAGTDTAGHLRLQCYPPHSGV